MQAGNTLWLQKQHEGRLLPAIITASIALLLALCLAATPATWAHFGFLFSHSRAIHVMTIDLSLLTLMSPFLVVTDARARGISVAQSLPGALLLGAAMLAVPMVGPGVYLLMRPVAGGKRAFGSGFYQAVANRVGFRRIVPSWVSRALGGSGGLRAAARGGAVRGGRQLRHGAAAAARQAGSSAVAAGSNAAAAARHAGSSAAAAGSNAAAAARHAGSNAATAARQAGSSAAAAGSNAAAAARHAGSNVAAAGSNAAANVVQAAQVPLPSGEQIHRGVGSVAAGTGFAAGAVVESVKRGWGRVKQGAGRFLSGGYPRVGAEAARAGSVDEAFVDYGGEPDRSPCANLHLQVAH